MNMPLMKAEPATVTPATTAKVLGILDIIGWVIALVARFAL